MPLPMVHLAIAVRMCPIEGDLPSPDFLLGSIAPDAIHMRPDTGYDDKGRVHLEDTPGSNHDRIRALLIEYWTEKTESADFAEGYAAHLLADWLWRETVLALFHQSIPKDLTAPEERSLYYQETDQIDFNLYHQMPWRPGVWRKLAAAKPRDFAGLLTAAEIGRWQDRTLNWFEKLKEEPKIEPVYLTDSTVQTFIEQAADMTVRCFEDWRPSVIK